MLAKISATRYWLEMVQNCNAHLCCAAVVVLSPEFVRKKYPMRELRIFVERKARDPSFVIIPVFYKLTVEQCSNLNQLYVSEPWPTSPGVPRVADMAVLEGWAEDVRKLLDSTGAKIEEVSVWDRGSSTVRLVAQAASRAGCRYTAGASYQHLHLQWASCCRPTITRGCWLGRW
jgi:hypothetical protein